MNAASSTDAATSPTPEIDTAGPSPLSTFPILSVDELSAQTDRLAQTICDAFAAAGTVLVSGPPDAQDGIGDLLAPGVAHGIVAGVRDASVAQVVLTLAPALDVSAVTGATDESLPEPWMAPLAGAMDAWSAELGGTVVNAMPIAGGDQLEHLLLSSPATTLMAAGLFQGETIVGTVSLVGRTSDEPIPASTVEPTAAGTTPDPASFDPVDPAPAAANQATTSAMAAPRPQSSASRTEHPGALALDAISVLADVEMRVTAELGRTRMCVSDLLALTPGSLIELDRTAGSPIDLLVNGTLIARGEVVVVDEEYGIRLTEITGSGDS